MRTQVRRPASRRVAQPVARRTRNLIKGKRLGELTIESPYIAIFASGNSMNDIPESELTEIMAHSFVITINYGPVKLPSHMHIWSDKHLSEWMDDHYSKHDKDRLFLAREKALKGREHTALLNKVDYWFDEKQERAHGNYTIVWLIQLLQKYFPEKTILVFGLDMTSISEKRAKWYDDHITFDRLKRGGSYRIQKKLVQCASQLDRYIRKKDNVINCNVKSQYTGFARKNWREVIK